MRRRWVRWVTVVLLAAPWVAVLSGTSAAQDPATPPATARVLFDFEDEADLANWSHLTLEDKKQPGADEPAAKLELSTDGVTSGKHALKITFEGGRWPTVTTAAVPVAENWVAQKFVTFGADVTVGRACLVGFRVNTEQRPRTDPWIITEICKPGKNEISGTLGGWWRGMEATHGKVTSFDIFMYTPHKGECIWVDNIRLGTESPAAPTNPVRFRVLGTEMTVGSVQELGKMLQDKWAAPKDRTLEEVEAEFRRKYEELKDTHPRAVLAIFRDGERGYDPANPEKVYAGWTDAHVNSHGPDDHIVSRAENNQGWGSLETFMRHRSLLARADLSSIPPGSQVLAARLVLIRAGSLDGYGPDKPNMWAVEPCNRPWKEYEVNAYEYAKDQYWKSVGGFLKPVSYEGDDPDFWPVYVAYGSSTPTTNVWDFTEALKFWIEGNHANHGFFIHGNGVDYMKVFSREINDVAKRPAILVVYDPKK